MEPDLIRNVPQEFTREGLLDFVRNSIDAESYGDEALRRVADEFVHQLGERSISLGEMLDGHGVRFFWAVNMGYAAIDPENAGAEYRHTSEDGHQYRGLDAMLAFLRDSVDIDEITDSYWEERHLEARRPPLLNLDPLGL